MLYQLVDAHMYSLSSANAMYCYIVRHYLSLQIPKTMNTIKVVVHALLSSTILSIPSVYMYTMMCVCALWNYVRIVLLTS